MQLSAYNKKGLFKIKKSIAFIKKHILFHRHEWNKLMFIVLTCRCYFVNVIVIIKYNLGVCRKATSCRVCGVG